jgi:hypothetical protein
MIGSKIAHFDLPRMGRLSVVSVQTQPNFTFGKAVSVPVPAMQERLSSDVRDYDVLPDGRFVSTVLAGEDVPVTNVGAQIRVVLNWFRELQERVPVK